MAKSPVSIPFTTDGVEVGLKDNTALPANARGFMQVGLDAANKSQFLRIGSDGRPESRLFDYNSTGIQATVSRELKVAQLYPFADLTSKYRLDPNLWDSLTATGGTTSHVAAQSGLRVEVTGASGSTADLVTNTYYKYQSGYTQLLSISIINSDTGQANQVRQWGYFDDGDGLFFQVSGTAVSIVERTSTSGSPVDTTYAKASWNVDPLDGTGPSGVTLDVSKGNIYEIEFQWFGVGKARYFIDGILVHEVAHANALTVPYMRTGNLPVRFRVTNTGASSAGSLTLICARVASQGQIHDPFEWVYSVASPTDKLVGVTEVPVLAIRPKATFNSIVNRSWVLPRNMAINTDGYKISFKLIYGAALTGASWTSVSSASATEYDVSASSYSGGDLIYQGYLPDGVDSQNVNLAPFFDVFGRFLRLAGFNGSGTNVADTLVVVAVNEAVGNTEVRSNFTWAEVR